MRANSYSGMTLRDHFAGQMLVGAVIEVKLDAPSELLTQEASARIAKAAYAVADAMLAEREKGAK